MASDPPQDTPMRPQLDDGDGSSDSNSGSGSESGNQEQEQEVEWLATSRQRRSTAGNRLNSLLQAEEPDDDLELLFAEAEDDEVFEVEDADSDVQMDSSDDDDDQGPAAGADDLEGEKELQKQAKAEQKAKRRKLNDGIPKIYKKKVKIDPTAAQAHTQAPRLKKKSERASWIPTPEDAPTRSSARGTTQKSKQELLLQMQDREIKRLKQLKHMEKAAAAKEAAKKPPMTQEDRLREAAKVEKRNKKSLSRWEEMEQQREEEQRERLAALQNRTLEGPVITWWSGMAEWVGGKLKKAGQLIVRDEPKEKVGRKRKAAEMEDEPSKTTDASKRKSSSDFQGVPASTAPAVDKIPDQKEGKDSIDPQLSSKALPSTDLDVTMPTTSSNVPLTQPSAPPESTPSPTKQTPPPSSSLQPPQEQPLPPPPPRPSSCLAPPPMHGPYPPPPDQNGPRKSSVLAPPPMHGPIPPPYSHLAPNPHPTQGQNPFQPPFKLAPPIQPHFDGSAPLPGFGYNFIAPNHTPYPGTIQAPPHAPPHAPAHAPPPPLAPPIPENKTPPPPAIEHTAINYLILNNFDNDAIKDKDIQTQILFNRKFQKIPRTKPTHSLCAITSYPAKYRDPSTGLAYCSPYAYKEIQRLKRGEYKWSKLVGCYVGSGTYAARGVPSRFLNAGAVGGAGGGGGGGGVKQE